MYDYETDRSLLAGTTPVLSSTTTLKDIEVAASQNMAPLVFSPGLALPKQHFKAAKHTALDEKENFPFSPNHANIAANSARLPSAIKLVLTPSQDRGSVSNSSTPNSLVKTKKSQALPLQPLGPCQPSTAVGKKTHSRKRILTPKQTPGPAEQLENIAIRSTSIRTTSFLGVTSSGRSVKSRRK
ncbi:hypothetical protein HDU91_003065 [Kappamyces sp. JEL0680]|nr:hypothetical protein HDU91_003065 [Kappamyces sp. JEL0680]